MASHRIETHPILPIEPRASVPFYWQGRKLAASQEETIASALFANGIHIFGHHHKDGAPQGIFCANGQCSQCLVLADGRPVKACMEPVQPGADIQPLAGLPVLPPVTGARPAGAVPDLRVPVLIIGGGPAGLSAAVELGKRGIAALLLDDKTRLGGKLVLQTHRFFGSTNAVYAGTRGIDIATRLENEVRQYPSVTIELNTTALAVFSDGKVGILRGGDEYVLVTPEVLLVAAGAREKPLAFAGNTLPGVYGAGAFQTLVNRDLVRAAERLFIVGGGNVGLIAGYHALQAGIEAAGLVEALPECGGYKVHRDKLARMGVPIYTSHTILSANPGPDGTVASVTTARVDDKFRPIPGSERSFACDTVLVAVGLDPVDEFYHKAREFGLRTFAAGDAEEIAEASAAIFSGKITGLEIAQSLGYDIGEIPPEWHRTAAILKSKPGRVVAERVPAAETGVFPVFHCSQEIPCNPCTSVCSQGSIFIDPNDIRALPSFIAEELGKACIGCEKCVTICPGLAISLVDYRKDAQNPTVVIPYEFQRGSLNPGDVVTVLDTLGEVLGNVPVLQARAAKANDRTIAVKLRAPAAIAKQIAGIRIQEVQVGEPMAQYVEPAGLADETVICRCERVTAGEIRALIRRGCHDVNEIKAVTRAGMGACGSKTCGTLVERLLRQEGVPEPEIVPGVRRPLFMEVPLGVFAGIKEGNGHGSAALENGHHDVEVSHDGQY